MSALTQQTFKLSAKNIICSFLCRAGATPTWSISQQVRDAFTVHDLVRTPNDAKDGSNESSLLEAVRRLPRLHLLVAAACSFEPALKDLLADQNLPATLFAPSDDALAAFAEGSPAALLQQEHGQAAYNMLRHHLVLGKYLSHDASAGRTILVAHGEQARIQCSKDCSPVPHAHVCVCPSMPSA